MAKAHVLLAKRTRHFDGAEAADRAVEVAAVGDRVDVRADQDRRQRGLAAFEPPDDVAGGVDPRIETGVAKESEGELAPGQVRLGIGDPVDAARSPADGVKLRQPAVHARAVGPKRRLVGRDADEGRRRGGGQVAHERAAIHRRMIRRQHTAVNSASVGFPTIARSAKVGRLSGCGI